MSGNANENVVWYVPYLLALLVSFFNILLNFSIQSTAKNGATFFKALFSFRFVISFCIGFFSLLSLLALYKCGLPIARALILAGAGSIVIGSLIAVSFFNSTKKWFDRLELVEWLMLLIIALLFLYRIFLKKQ